MRVFSWADADSAHPAASDAACRGGFAIWPAAQTCPVHLHEGAAEVFVVLDGTLGVEIEGEYATLESGMAVFVAPGERHRIEAVGDEPVRMFWLVAPNRSPRTTYFRQDGTPVPWDLPGQDPQTQAEVDALP